MLSHIFAFLVFNSSEVTGAVLTGKTHEIHQKEKVASWERIVEQLNPT